MHCPDAITLHTAASKCGIPALSIVKVSTLQHARDSSLLDKASNVWQMGHDQSNGQEESRECYLVKALTVIETIFSSEQSS